MYDVLPVVCMEQRELCKVFPNLREWCAKGLWAPFSFHGSVGHRWAVVERYTKAGECENAAVHALDLSPGFSDCRR